MMLRSNSQCGLQDPHGQEARSSWDAPSNSKSYGETHNNIVDYRVSGIPLSTVEQQDEKRVKKLIEKFEKHQHKESYLKDLSQTQKINEFSKKSQELIADVNNAEIFEVCENSSKQKCLECNTYWDIRLIYCSCGRNMKPSRSSTTSQQNNYDVTSIPGYVFKKNNSRGSKHGPSGRRRMNYQAKQTLKKAQNGSYPTILARWHGERDYRASLEATGLTENDIILFDRIAMEKHYCSPTKAESIQKSKHWILTLNAEGPQQPLNQRPDFAQAKRECKRLDDEHLAKTQQNWRPSHRSQQVRQRKEQQFEGGEDFDYVLDPETGWRFYKELWRKLQTDSSSSSHWDKTHWKTSNWHSSRPDDW